MSKHAAWLRGETQRWTAANIISNEQAENIRAFYPTEDAAPWGLILFCAFGAVVLGLGVILLIAHNWQAIPRLGKLAIIVGSTGAAHAAGFNLLEKGSWKASLAEAMFLLGTILFGAGIWLVAQAYNIEEHFPNGFLFWGLGALALAWVIRSVPQTIAAIVLLTVWSGCETIDFQQPASWGMPILLFGVGPLLWLKRSPIVTAVWISSLYFLVLANAINYGGAPLGFTVALSISVLLVALGRWGAAKSATSLEAKVTLVFGYGGFLFVVLLLSFNELVREMLTWGRAETKTWAVVYDWSFFGLALACWLLLLWIQTRRKIKTISLEDWFCPIALVYAQLLASGMLTADSAFVAGVFKIVFIGIAIVWMMRGSQKGSLTTTVLGSVLFSVWIFARYFDLFDSLAARGFAFLILGAALFAEGFFYRQRRLETAKGAL